MEVIFQKSLKKSDVASKLSVPSKCLKKLPRFEGHVVDLRVRDRRGSFWRFRCSIRRRSSYPKPVISGDWHRFAASKGLSIGDEVKLFEEIDQATGVLVHYRVEVKKAINLKLFGVSIHHAPATVL